MKLGMNSSFTIIIIIIIINIIYSTVQRVKSTNDISYEHTWVRILKRLDASSFACLKKKKVEKKLLCFFMECFGTLVILSQVKQLKWENHPRKLG